MPSDIPPRIRARRVTAGLSQDELAEKLGTSLTTVEAWEEGSSIPSLTSLDRLAVALEVEIEDLVGVEGLILRELKNLNERIDHLRGLVEDLQQGRSSR